MNVLLFQIALVAPVPKIAFMGNWYCHEGWRSQEISKASYLYFREPAKKWLTGEGHNCDKIGRK